MNCQFGCGGKASFTFKNGKRCCAKVCSSCPGMKKKNSSAKAGINPWEGKEHPRGMLGCSPWNKGLTKNTSKLVKSISNKVSKAQKGRKGRPQSEESREKISKAMKAVGAGGYRKGAGRGKKGWYKGIFCDSSWELAFVLWCELKGRKVKRAKKKFPYIYLGKRKNYLPDFRYCSSTGKWKYVEIKGYVSEQWKAKKRAFPHELLMIGHRAVKEKLLPVVIEHYGHDFIKLYERRD